MPDTADIAIVGGGAAGLAAAIFAAEAARESASPPRIVVLDGAKALGAKILVSGGGRCNVTHDSAGPEDFNGSRPVVRNVLSAFPPAAAVRWFATMGVELKREETGKLFPVADSARAVLNALLNRCGELDIALQTGSRVSRIVPPGSRLGPRAGAIGVVGAIDAAGAMGKRTRLPVEPPEDPKKHGQASTLAHGTRTTDRGDAPYLTPPARVVPEELERRPADPGDAPYPNPPRNRGDEADGLFSIEHSGGTTRAARVVVATGGRSLPRSGSDGAGWDMLRQLGHTVTPTYAALVPLVLAPEMFHASLAGIALEAELSTFAEGKMIDRRRGSLLWTHFGISGPVAMDASRHWVKAKESGMAVGMRCNLLPPDGFEAVERWLIDLASSRQRALAANAIAARLPERVAAAVVAHVGIDPAIPCGQLSRPLRRALCHALTALPLPVAQHRGWNYAEVTAGGVPLNEIDFRTMQSRKVPGLYLAGEILDCEGRIGGFNFQWAWATGFLAGRASGAEVVG